jgi:hypothetical protein
MKVIDQQEKGTVSNMKKSLFIAVVVVLNLVVCCLMYLGVAAFRSIPHYDAHSRWDGVAYHQDKNYGYFPTSNKLTFHTLQNSEKVPITFDDNGFRIAPVTGAKQQTTSDTKILFLGGSFTHGYGVPAEKTFANLTASAVGAQAMNAGGSGWGLSQMVLRARDVIPRLKPGIVVVQYSSWLPKRSMSYYGPTRFGKTPAPFFFESEGTVDIHKPAFQAIKFKLPISEFAGKGLLPFIWHVGIPLFVHDDYMMLRTLIRRKLGLLAEPISSARQKVVDFAFAEIQRLCSENNARMLVVLIPRSIDDYPVDSLASITAQKVHTLEFLTKEIAEPTAKNWSLNYRFWRGNPPEMVDTHPNVHMHSIIANQLIDAVRSPDKE